MMFNNRLKAARKAKKLTQEQLAGKLQTTKGTISNYENGHSTPSNEMLVLLSKILDVTTDYLLGVTDNPKPVDYKLAGISDDDYNNLSAYQKEVINFFLTRENLFFKNQPENLLDALEQFEVYYEVWKKQQENKK